MSKEKKNVKICGVKKINHYTKEICISELARLQKGNKTKGGLDVPDFNSKYQQHVRARLAELEAKK